MILREIIMVAEAAGGRTVQLDGKYLLTQDVLDLRTMRLYWRDRCFPMIQRQITRWWGYSVVTAARRLGWIRWKIDGSAYESL